jgi:hypothetical protein
MNTNSTQSNMMQLVAVVERGEGDNKKNYWTRIGVAFENRDGSWNLRFDYFPTRGETTVQMRAIDPKEDTKEAEPEAAREPAKARSTGGARR